MTETTARRSLRDALQTASVMTAPARRLIGDVATRLANDPLRAFDLLYRLATSESNRIYGARGLAEHLVRHADEPLEFALQRLLLVQAVAAGSAGAALSVGNLVTLPLAALFSMYIKTVSVAAIAKLAGHDLSHEATKARVYAIVIGETNASRKYRGLAVDGSKRLIEKFAVTFCSKATTVTRLGRAVPFVGAGVSGAFEMISIRTVSRKAIAHFFADHA